MAIPIVPPMVNGEAYAWAQIKMNLLGVLVTGIISISYDEDQEITYNHGIGSYAVNYGMGRITAKGSLTIYMDDVLELIKKAPYGRLQNIPLFNIPVTFLPTSGTLPVTDVIHNIKFLNNGRDMKEGDTKVEIKLDFLASHIEFNA